MKRRVEVTAEDIAYGRRGDPCNCPIARACKRAGIKFPSVWPDDSDGDGELNFSASDDAPERCGRPLPAEANKFALDFDDGRIVEPFSFEFDDGETTGEASRSLGGAS